MRYKFINILSKIFSIFLVTLTVSEAKTFKIKNLEIELFKEDNLLKSFKHSNEGGWGLIKTNVFAEKNEDNEVTSIIKIVTTRIDKYGKDVSVANVHYDVKYSPIFFFGSKRKTCIFDVVRCNQ